MMMMTMIMVLNVCMAYDDDVAMLVRMNRIWISEWMDRYFFLDAQGKGVCQI